MNRAFGRVARVVAAVAGLWVLWACGPVYIPVPPPSQIAFTSETLTDSDGQSKTFWITAGGVSDAASQATFYIFDQERNAGVIAVAASDGSFQAPPFEGTMGDHVQIYFRGHTGQTSTVVCRILSDQQPSAPTCP